jgi:hypothetical protein
MKSFLKHVQANLVAIISLVVAVSALNINTMRANVSEHQHNIRDASFRVLSELSQLQLLIDNSHYGRQSDSDGPLIRVNPIEGWARINYMRDLAVVVPSPGPESLESLYVVWSAQINALADKDKAKSLKANKVISEKIALAREDIKTVLGALK